jgi:CRISPR-associated protein Cmr2
MSKQEHLLLFSIGPVQSFIASARKTEDLWAGSYLLSFLVEKAIQQLHQLSQVEGGSVELIFPAEHDIAVFPQVASFPNRFLAVVTMSSSQVPTLCGELASFIRYEFEGLCLFGLEDAFAGATFDDMMRQLTQEQARGVLEINWAVEPLDGLDYESARRNVERRLASVKNNRHFSLQDQDGIVCTVCGEREALRETAHDTRDSIGKMKYQLRSTWGKLSSKYRDPKASDDPLAEEDVGAGRIRSNETLCGVCLGKRTTRDYLQAQLSRTIPRFRSTHEVSNPLDYYAILSMDGDNMGRWLAGKEGDFSEPPGTITFHRLISERLARFAGDVVPRRVQEAGGDLVYAGGDDVLAFLPLPSLLEFMNQIRADFASLEFGLHPNATASAGVAVVHKMYPLNLALQTARNMEKRAKQYIHPHTGKQKDALGMAVFTRSGEVSEFVVPWTLQGSFSRQSQTNVTNLMGSLVDLLGDELSPSFAQHFTEAFSSLLGVDSAGQRKIAISSDPVINTRALTVEMCRLMERSLRDPRSNIRNELPVLSETLLQVHDLMDSSRAFFGWLKTMQFLARMQKQEVRVG